MTWLKNLPTGGKVALGLTAMFSLSIALYAAFGSEGRNEEYQPQNEFQLDPWISIHIGGLDLSVNKAVLYLLLAAAFTVGTMTWIARKMQQRPNRVQAAVEALYDLANNNITRGNMPPNYAKVWFPFVGTLFFFIWF